ncbi:MAG TPA: hypothetical protein VMV05_05575 [bacterium]|nr:hypothetical protein [bacterium]
MSLLFFVPLQAHARMSGWHYWGPDEPMDDIASFFESSLTGQSLFDHDYFWADGSNWLTGGHSKSMRKNWVGMGNVEEWREYLITVRHVQATRRQVIDLIYDGDFDLDDPQWINDNPPFPSRGKKPSHKLEECQDVKDYVDWINQVNPLEEQWLERDQPNHYIYSPYRKRKHSLTPTPEPSPEEIESVLKLGRARAEDPGLDPFLRAKYAFQVIRAAVTQEFPENAIQYYEKYFGNSPVHSLVRYRALGYRAKAYLDLNQKQNALLDYLDIIDQSPELRSREIQSTRKAFTREDFLALVPAVKGPHRLTTLYYVLGVHDPRDYSAETLEKMLETGVRESQTEATLIRMIQAIESENSALDRFALLGVEPPSFDKSSPLDKPPRTPVPLKLDSQRYDAWIRLCEKAAQNKQARQPLLWAAAGGYLALLEGNQAAADRLLGQAARGKTQNESLKGQIHLLNTLMALRDAKKQLSSNLQKRLMEDLDWAGRLKGDGHNPQIEHSIWNLLAQKYLTFGDYPHAVLCFCAAKGPDDVSYLQEHEKAGNFLLDALMTDEELAQTQKIIRTPRPKTMDARIAFQAGLLPDDIQIIRTVREIRKDDYNRALTLLSALPKVYLKGEKRHVSPYWEPDFYGEGSQIQMKTFVILRHCPLVEHLQAKSNEATEVSASPLALPPTPTPTDRPAGLPVKKFHGWEPPNYGQESMDLLEYVKMMARINNRISDLKAKGDRHWADAAFEKAVILAEQPLTHWPEVRDRNDRPGWNRTYYNERAMEQFPFGIPAADRDIQKRYQDFLDSFPDNDKKALEICGSIVEAKAGRERSAKCEAFMAALSSDNLGAYKPTDPGAQKYLGELKDRFSDTDFYKNFITWCDAYTWKEEDHTPVWLRKMRTRPITMIQPGPAAPALNPRLSNPLSTPTKALQ